MPKASHGSLNLATWDFTTDGMIALDGEWEFYWQQLLVPNDFSAVFPPLTTDYIALPRAWNGHAIDQKELSGEGYATYRLILQQAPRNARYALKLLNASSAYVLWVNGKQIAGNGKVGINKQTMRPQYKPLIVAFDVQKSDIEIILQVSNFNHRKGGVWNSLKFGSEQQIRENQLYRHYYDLFLLGALLMMGLYHLGLYALRRKDPSTLYFGLFCLVIGIRTLFYREMAITMLIPEMVWVEISAIRYLLTFSALPLFTLFIQSLYPIETSKKIISLIISVELGLIFLVSVTEASIYTYAMPIHQLVTLSACLYIVYALIRAARNKRPSAFWLLAGFFAFFLIIINDILVDHTLINSVYLMPLGLLLFIFSQAFAISMRFSRAFNRAELLTNAYARFVPNNFLQYLCKDDIINVELGDNIQRNMTVLFSDIRSFSSISETMTPQENFNFLNSYLECMEPIITQHQGFIDKYIGDAIMALFEKNADNAVEAGISMLRKLEKYNQYRQKSGYQPIYIGIGINTGELMLGIIGGKNRMDGTVISDAVNLAARMEELTKIYKTPLLISENSLRSLSYPDRHYIRMIDRVKVYGKMESIAIYEVFDTDPQQQRNAKLANQVSFNQAVKLCSLGNYKPAKVLFQRCLQKAPEDKVVHIYLLRIERLL
ncbi:MAG TPA: adenylate/guanylate cyclase domain-containing protein [Leucothrix mucor]|uniref:Adenylate/guanylate cyclase domain-containing protein n=1 Tax=Leucothrix mucor TaxID=45248 RepID=A0A7V2WV88_LEUMU|nr:adenylate/guanylate cyclase domain-containing protein [Leucothrix mucor]